MQENHINLVDDHVLEYKTICPVLECAEWSAVFSALVQSSG